MNLHITAKLQKVLKNKLSSGIISQNPQMENYHAKILQVGGMDFILITNDQTLYSFFFPMPAKNASDLNHFEHYVAQSIFKILISMDFPQVEFEKVLEVMENFNYSKSANKSLISTMNNIGLTIEHYICENLDLIDINTRINKTPQAPLDYAYSTEVFKKLLLEQ